MGDVSMAGMTCPHDGSTLDAQGNCPKASSHGAAKGRASVKCPLCGGPKHDAQVAGFGMDFVCVWRQFSAAKHGAAAGLPTFNATLLRDLADYLDTAAPKYGKAAQYAALASAGTPVAQLTPAMERAAKRLGVEFTPPTVTPLIPPAGTAPVPFNPMEHSPEKCHNCGATAVLRLCTCGCGQHVCPAGGCWGAQHVPATVVPERPTITVGQPMQETPPENDADLAALFS